MVGIRFAYRVGNVVRVARTIARSILFAGWVGGEILAWSSVESECAIPWEKLVRRWVV